MSITAGLLVFALLLLILGRFRSAKWPKMAGHAVVLVAAGLALYRVADSILV